MDSAVATPADVCWTVQHNSVWSPFFRGSKDTIPWKRIHFKARRMLYDEIFELSNIPNFKSAKTLGFCLNVMGLDVNYAERKAHGSECYALKRAVLSWTRKNYLHLRAQKPKIADACLVGGISFDEANNRLVKTYAESFGEPGEKVYFDLLV